jgi:hypothetical protein
MIHRKIYPNLVKAIYESIFKKYLYIFDHMLESCVENWFFSLNFGQNFGKQKPQKELSNTFTTFLQCI